MSEYGRGPGSEPWYPQDPLYGDLGWAEEQPPDGAHAPRQGQPGQLSQPGQSSPYGGEPLYDDGSSYGGQQQYRPQQPPPPPQHQQYPAQEYPPQEYPPQGYPPQEYPSTEYDTWGTGQQPLLGQPYGGQPEQGRPFGRQPHTAYPDQGQDAGYGQQYTGWDTGQHGQPAYDSGPGDPYGQQPRGHHAEEPGYHGPGSRGVPGPGDLGPGAPGPGMPAPGAPGSGAHGPGVAGPGTPVPGTYPRPGQPTARRRAPQPPEPEPAPPNDWDPGPDQGEHAFFAGDGGDSDDDDVDEPGGRRGRGARRGRGGNGRQRRGGCACLVMSLVLVGVVGGVGYYGYQFYEDHFGPPPDFAGDGTDRTVTVEIPKGASGYTMGRLLKEKGVVKSVDAFVDAQKDNPKGQTIQDGFYTLHPQMSAADVIALMLDPKSRNNLIIAEGRRNVWVYAQIDTRLGLKAGTTRSVAKKDWKKLGLPDWAVNHGNVKDPLEGFLYPSSYPVGEGMKPEDVLKKMVGTATQKYDALHLGTEADRLHVDGPWQVITIASLVQAEGKTHDDFSKMSEVVYNRLKPTNTETNQLLQFDSTFNYLKGESKIDISESEINSNHDPYNTYTQRGLTPGPIGNPGAEALAAALHPTHDGWIYFVATDGMNKTEFAKTYAEFQKLKEKFNDSGRN